MMEIKPIIPRTNKHYKKNHQFHGQIEQGYLTQPDYQFRAMRGSERY